MSAASNRSLLNLEGAGLPLAGVVSVVSLAVAVTIVGSELVHRLDTLEADQDERWGRQDEVIQALEWKLHNPELYVPDPRDQGREITASK